MPKAPLPPVDILIEQLHGSDWTTRCDAARLLGQSRDPRAVDALLPDLKDSDWRVRRNAAQALGALRDPRAVEPLFLALQDRTMTVRQRAIVALGRIKDPRALPALLEIVQKNTSESYDAAKAVRKFGKKALPEIARAYKKSRNQQLLSLLIELKYEGAFDLILPLLVSQNPAERLTAVRELGTLGNQKAIPYLLDQLQNGDPLFQGEVVRSLGNLQAIQSVPALLGLLTDDELYGPRSTVYHAVTEAFQVFGGIRAEIESAFPGKYPAMFNMGGAPFSLPEAMGLWGNTQSNAFLDAIMRFQTGFGSPDETDDPLTRTMRTAMDDFAWKFGVMFEDARDAKKERVTRLLQLLVSKAALSRAAAALTLPWYGEEWSLEPLRQSMQDPENTVRMAATWAERALRKAISYRRQFGM